MDEVRKKLIEVDLPLDEINAESKREKSIRHGHPSTLHMWWARRPLATCRAVIFASIVDDPSSCSKEFPSEQEQQYERKRLHDIIRKLVKWESTDESESKLEAKNIQNEARYEIARSIARSRGEPPPDQGNPFEVLRYLSENAPPIHDPFAGGGSIPLEAQRLGLRAIASDLNPVAVLINKALIELPPKFMGRPPVNPDAADMNNGVSWARCRGLANDIRYYGRWMREKAWERIGHLHPKITLPDGGESKVIAWLWARTVPCSNPACGIAMPLMVTFELSTKANNQHWTRPIIDRDAKSVSFVVQDHPTGVPRDGTVNRNGATCIACDTTSPLTYVREQSRLGNMGEQMTAIVAEGNHKRLFLSPTDEHTQTALLAKPAWRPGGDLPERALGFAVQKYGFTQWHQLFTNRQLTTLTTFSELIPEVHNLIGENGADVEYADTVCTYLSLAVSKLANIHSAFASWMSDRSAFRETFARQAIPMIWDFAESNPFTELGGGIDAIQVKVQKVVERLPALINAGQASQADSSTVIYARGNSIIVTDPPYYDNIGYADLSNFFYVWLRPLLRNIYPDLFASILSPIDEEMIAAPRFKNSRERFEGLMGKALRLMREHCSSEFPSIIFYAYKQQEEERGNRVSTGWETMLNALMSSELMIVGTWPMRTESPGRIRQINSNALSSSIILVCRKRPANADVATRSEFIKALKAKLPPAVIQMQSGSIAPVDLAQAAIGPGMAVFTGYSKVLNAGGETVRVREALTLINQTLDEVLADQEGKFDASTRWALAWFEQSGFGDGDFGEAETLSKAKNTSIRGMVETGILKSDAGNVRLLKPSELPDNWDPGAGQRLTIWAAAHHLSAALDRGERAAAKMMAKLGADAETVRELAYRLYHICDQKNRPQEAQSYNALVQSWPEIVLLARERRIERQASFVGEDDRIEYLS